MNVCVLVGSLRKASLNGMLANTLISLAPSSLKLDIVEIGQLPLYNEDLETAAVPAPWTAFRQRVNSTIVRRPQEAAIPRSMTCAGRVEGWQPQPKAHGRATARCAKARPEGMGRRRQIRR
jgi:hypothetical protein